MNCNLDARSAAVTAPRRLSGNVRLCEKVDRALRATGYLCLRDVEILGYEGLVVLKGRVPSYYTKQVAQVAARTIPGVHEVCNDLEVGLFR